MSYLNKIFFTNFNNQTLFFPWGKLSRGFIVTPTTQQRIIKIVALQILVTTLLTISILVLNLSTFTVFAFIAINFIVYYWSIENKLSTSPQSPLSLKEVKIRAKSIKLS